jgi:hypothetical protein
MQENLVSLFVRRACLATAFSFLCLLLVPSLRAQTSVADQTLFNSANHERSAAGLPALKWDAALANAAHQHALKMAQANQLSHQFPGEPAMQERAKQVGAHFSVIAENVAQGPTATSIHSQWMNSPPHRANILDRDLNSIGISVVQSGNTLFAVEDFSNAVPTLTIEQQEQVVASMLDKYGWQVDTGGDARKTCEQDKGWAGPKPTTVLRYETSDIGHFPPEISQKLGSEKYHSASVGACKTSASASDFTRFRIAILLF